MKLKNKIKKIIVHKGLVHTDDIMCVALALNLERGEGLGALLDPLPVFRRDPTVEEMDDESVLVMDVGGQHAPLLNNYDHHLGVVNNPPICALTLYLQGRHPERLKQLRTQTKWFSVMEFIDDRGPYEWAKKEGLLGFPFGLLGPLDGAIKAMIESASDAVDGRLPKDLCQFLAGVGAHTLEEMDKTAKTLARLHDNIDIIDVDGVKGIVYLSKDTTGLQMLRDSKAAEGIEYAFCISLDDRGEGLSLYRFNDDPRVNFAKLTGRANIIFAHPGGFIAKTGKGITTEMALQLVKECLVK